MGGGEIRRMNVKDIGARFGCGWSETARRWLPARCGAAVASCLWLRSQSSNVLRTDREGWGVSMFRKCRARCGEYSPSVRGATPPKSQHLMRPRGHAPAPALAAPLRSPDPPGAGYGLYGLYGLRVSGDLGGYCGYMGCMGLGLHPVAFHPRPPRIRPRRVRRARGRSKRGLARPSARRRDRRKGAQRTAPCRGSARAIARVYAPRARPHTHKHTNTRTSIHSWCAQSQAHAPSHSNPLPSARRSASPSRPSAPVRPVLLFPPTPAHRPRSSRRWAAGRMACTRRGFVPKGRYAALVVKRPRLTCQMDPTDGP